MLFRRLLLVGLLVTAGSGLIAASAWSCVPVAQLDVSPAVAKPGQTVAVSGRSYANGNPVVIHFNAIDGPVLATLPSDRGSISGTVTIPDGTKTGNYVLVATQDPFEGGARWGIPTRTLLSVTGDGGVPVVGQTPIGDPTPRVAELARSQSVGAGGVALVALGVGALGLMVAAIAAGLSGRGTSAGKATA